MNMNWWAGLKDVDFNEKGNYFTPGNYMAQVESIRTKQGFKGHALIFSFVIVSADNDVQPGEHRDWVLKLDGPNARMALGDLKSFVFGMFGLDKDNRALDATASAIAERMASAANPLGGMTIGIEAFDIDVKPSANNPSGKFTKLRWHTQPNTVTVASLLGAPAPAPAPAAQRPPVPPTGQAWGAPPALPPPPPPPPPPAGKVRPANLPPNYIRADGWWWDGKDWNP